METTRKFRVKLAGEAPRRGTVTSRLWLASVDVMSLLAGPQPLAMAPLGQPAGPTPYRIARRMVVRL